MNENALYYKSLNQSSLDEAKAEAWYETGNDISKARGRAGKIGGIASVSKRFTGKTKEQISEIMRRVKKGIKINN
jgi:hypothetical protein